jgi:hypothetical protein
MTTTATFRAELRRDLRDEDSAAYRWTDTVLDRHITQAVREFSRAAPLQKTTTITTTNGSRELSVSSLSDVLEIEAIEFPTGQYPQAFIDWRRWATTLYLDSDKTPDGTNCRLFYLALHDISGTWTIPPAGEEVVLIGAGAYALLDRGAMEVPLVNAGGGDAEEDYLVEGWRRLERFNQELLQLASKVRRRRLYTPGDARPSRSVVSWPA